MEMVILFIVCKMSKKKLAKWIRRERKKTFTFVTAMIFNGERAKKKSRKNVMHSGNMWLYDLS